MSALDSVGNMDDDGPTYLIQDLLPAYSLFRALFCLGVKVAKQINEARNLRKQLQGCIITIQSTNLHLTLRESNYFSLRCRIGRLARRPISLGTNLKILCCLIN
jgi:hypothetical protein